jgi:PAS domain S-box-containing protein
MDGPIRVLHVDDEPDFADLTATFLERNAQELTVETATSASEGLDRLADGAVDCVVSDYDMPGMDGLEFLADVRETSPDLPFILFTGKGSEEVASDAISAGVTDYLQKGGGTEQYELLATRIENAVERARMQTERQRQLHAIETAREGISILDADLRFITVNDAYASLFGYEPAEMVSESWELVYADEGLEDVDEGVAPALREEGYYHGETAFERANGSTFVGDHVVSKTEGGEYVCLARDVTERTERERELQRQNERLESFASVVSHDLRNPLNVAELRLELAREECDSEHLADVADALGRSQALIDDLLALAREGEPVSDVEPVDLADLVGDCWHNVETTAATVDAGTDRVMRADPNRLKQLLENLFANAVDHGGADVTVTVGDLADGFYVADDGPGVPPSEREQVFESGYSTADGDTGFGLAIVAEIAEAHGWSVAVTDSEDGGARFEITGVETGNRE